MQLVLLTALGVGGATVFGSVIGFAFRKISHRFSDIVLAFAAGVMLAAAVLGLIIPSAEEYIFKVYMRDCGLFVSMLEDGTQYDILQGNLFGYKGAIFENLIAYILAKMGRKLDYFHKDSGLEVDFVIRYKGECTLVEVKATTGNTKSTKTVLRHPEKYHVEHAIKLGNYNVGRMDQILTLPLYMAFLLREVWSEIQRSRKEMVMARFTNRGKPGLCFGYSSIISL